MCKDNNTNTDQMHTLKGPFIVNLQLFNILHLRFHYW